MAEKDYYTEGVPVPEAPPPGAEPAPWGRTNVVGARRPRVDAYERVSGTAVYPSDLCLPDMLYGAILRSPHPRARVKRLDAGGRRLGERDALGVVVLLRHEPLTRPS